jgi:altronate hydrolase
MHVTTVLTSSAAAKTLTLQREDDLIVALTDLPAGEPVSNAGRSYTPPQRVPAKHKFAARPVRRGQRVRMYGVTVGIAQADIAAGELVTTDNLAHATDEPVIDPLRSTPWRPPDVSRFAAATFDGYHREDGRVGTANHWLVIPLVFCENRNIETLREALIGELGFRRDSAYREATRRLIEQYRDGASASQILDVTLPFGESQSAGRVFPNVDGLKFLTHTLGCGGTREDAQTLCGLLAGYIDHPNVAGATVLSLGCQNAQIGLLRKELHQRNPRFDKPLIILEQQQLGTESKLIAEAMKRTFAGLIEANELQRRPAPLSRLTIGVECGGSDGFSGITANPAIGHCADLLVALGGSVILSEFPELAGVEQDLVDRCASIEAAGRFLQLMRAYDARARAVGSGFDRNPSPGNIADGLITDAMKSAGAVRKGGTSPVVDVLDYPQPARRPGLSLLCTPGNDVESTTALAGSGANVILFSTGLGTPTGNVVAPTIKVSTSTALAQRMPDIIDFDAGPILTGALTIAQAGERLLDLLIATAGGRYVPHAVVLGQDDFIPWKRGVSL